MQVIGHHHKGVECESMLGTIFEKGLDHEECIGFDLKRAATVGGHCRDEIGAALLWTGNHPAA